MIPLYWYLGIGVVILIIVYGTHRLREQKKSQFVRDLLDAANPERRKFSYRILTRVVVPVLAAILVVAVWPVAVFIEIKDLLMKIEDAKGGAEARFVVERQHLLERLTVQEVEKREFVTDPLKAVPDLPFGHLNGAWTAFLSGHRDELWSFTARSRTRLGRNELRSGYVSVRGGTPGAHFLTVLKVVEDDAQGGDRPPGRG